jgi:FAD:protein FMN transferase
VEKITLARNAMATRFEFILVGSDPVRLRAAGEEALDEIERIESQLSLYKGGSEIATINSKAAFGAVRASPEVFALLSRAREFSEISGGAFDITVAPLVRCWGFMKGSGSRPTDAEIVRARENTGTIHLEMNDPSGTVRFKRDGMMLDLGSIGKGYALDVAADVLADAGLENALLHGGTSTIIARGNSIEGPWKVAIEQPNLGEDQMPGEPIAVVELNNQALSVSAVSGKFFTSEGKTYGHVIDPRTGWPATDALLGAVVTDSAAASDALSTAILLASDDNLRQLEDKVPGIRYIQARMEDGKVRLRTAGIEVLDERIKQG